MKPESWGNHAWIFLHAVTLNYPEKPTKEDKLNYLVFFTSLRNVLPCNKCQHNFASHLKKYPLTDDILSSKKKLIYWLIDIHNAVNYMNDKKLYGYDEAIQNLNEIYNQGEKENNYYIFFLVLITVLIGTIFYLCYGIKHNSIKL